jgi:hypothetical protein
MLESERGVQAPHRLRRHHRAAEPHNVKAYPTGPAERMGYPSDAMDKACAPSNLRRAHLTPTTRYA